MASVEHNSFSTHESLRKFIVTDPRVFIRYDYISFKLNYDVMYRSDNCIKNYYYSTLRKHLRRINKSLKQCQIGN